MMKGGVVVKLENEDIVLLKLITWSNYFPKDLHLSYPNYPLFSQRRYMDLVYRKFIYLTKNKKSYSITKKGIQLLQEDYGFSFNERIYTSRSDIFKRRHQDSYINTTMFAAGISIFNLSPKKLAYPFTYFSALLARNKQALVKYLSSTRFIGVLSTHNYYYMIFYVDDEMDNLIHLVNELKSFHNIISQDNQKPLAMIFANKSYGNLINSLKETPQRQNQFKAINYRTVFDKTNLPIIFLETSSHGALQIRILSQQNYRQRLLQKILGVNELNLVAKIPQADCAFPYGDKGVAILGIDMDIKRIKSVIQMANNENEKVHIFALEYQNKILLDAFLGTKALFYNIKENTVMECFAWNTLLKTDEQNTLWDEG